jgi:hypothetical protein
VIAPEELTCRCGGITGDAECENAATQEDGLCDTCRCEHGCCTDHGHPFVGLTFGQRTRLLADSTDPTFRDAADAAYDLFAECCRRKVYA